MGDLELGATKMFEMMEELLPKLKSFLNNTKSPGDIFLPENNESATKIIKQNLSTLPIDPGNFQEILDVLFTKILPHGCNSNHPNFFGFFMGGNLPHSIFANIITTTINRFSPQYILSPGENAIETLVIKWFTKAFNFPKKAFGLLTTGSSISFLLALTVARNEYLYRDSLVISKIACKFPDLSEDQLMPITNSFGVVYTSEQSHHMIRKTIKIIGIPSSNLRLIEVNQNMEMDVIKLQNQIEIDIGKGLRPFCVIATCGTTSSGAVDPITSIISVIQYVEREYKIKIWLHADGAYGGPFYLTDRGKKSMCGLDLVDSLNFDFHKSFHFPLGNACLIVKNCEYLRNLGEYSAPYLPFSPMLNAKKSHVNGECVMEDSDSSDDEPVFVDFGEMGVELTRESRGLKIWLGLNMIGMQAFIDDWNEKLDMTNYFVEKLNENFPNVFVIRDHSLTVVNFRVNSEMLLGNPFFVDFSKNEINNYVVNKLKSEIHRRGKVFVAVIKFGELEWIRVSFLNFRTHLPNVNLLIEEIALALDSLKIFE